MNIKPLRGRALIRKIRTEQVAGLFVAKSSKDDKLSRGEVIAVGECEKDKDFGFEKGDVVMFPTWNETLVSSCDDGEYVVIKAEEVLCVEEATK